jgi:hypothetical protein
LKNPASPPRLALRLLEKFSGWEDDYGAAGDFEEFYRALAEEQGIRKARRACWKQVLAAFPEYVKNIFIWSDAMLKSYIRIAVRNLWKSKVHSFINIAGLALGMACCLVILFWVRQERSFDRFHERADRLYRVIVSVEKSNFRGSALMAPLAGHLQQTYPEITAATVFSSISGGKISFGLENGTTAEGSFVDQAFFKMFTFPFLKGAPETAFSNPSSIVITEDLAHKLFGSADPVGKTLKLNDGNRDLIVSGVLRKIPRNSTLRFDYLLSYEIAPRWMKTWDVKSTPVFVRLRDAADPADVGRKIAGVLDVRHPDWHNTLELQPVLRDSQDD